MKILHKDFALNQTGTAKLMAEEPDDVWVLYNLILPGDVVSADTTRKVHHDSSAKKNTASRVKLTLQLKVTCRDFHKDSSTLRLQGRNLHHNQHVAAGSFHTISLEPNKPFLLQKNLWQNDAVQTLNDTTQKERSNSNATSIPDLAVVLFHPHHAEIHIVAEGATMHCTKVEACPNSRKNGKVSSSVFFRRVLAALVKRVDFKVLRGVVVTSEEFRAFAISEARKMGIRWIEDNKTSVAVVEDGDSLEKVLSNPAVTVLVKDGRVRAFRELWEMVCNDSGRACYGSEEVERAREMKAIEILLITDDLYRNEEVGTRQRYDGLVKSVKDGGGKALVYSPMHVSAAQLSQLTGVAAILRFPLPDLELQD
ncbi:protein pelota [Vigna unguiculata]|uniref:Protein pelota n=1 Tax=Vigna unguiculata TaxID=3917 RepID=A0A4D6M9D5_VIGUN|nr:protein pelota [Vigna unguiculata]